MNSFWKTFLAVLCALIAVVAIMAFGFRGQNWIRGVNREAAERTCLHKSTNAVDYVRCIENAGR